MYIALAGVAGAAAGAAASTAYGRMLASAPTALFASDYAKLAADAKTANLTELPKINEKRIEMLEAYIYHLQEQLPWTLPPSDLLKGNEQATKKYLETARNAYIDRLAQEKLKAGDAARFAGTQGTAA